MTPSPDPHATLSEATFAATSDRNTLRTALNGVVARSVRPVALGILILHAVYTPSHFFVLPPPANYLMAGSAFLSLLAALAVWRRGHRVRPENAHATIALLGLILLANSLLHIYVVAQPEQATNLLLVIVGLGSIMLSVWWLLGTVALTLVGWAGVMVQLGARDEALHYGFALVSATGLSLVVQHVRRRTLGRLEHLRVRDRDQRRRLEKSVSDLAHSEERFRRFAEASFEAMLRHDNARVLDVNQRLATMLGYAPEALQSASIDTLFEASTETAMMHREASVETPRELRGRCRFRDTRCRSLRFATSATTKPNRLSSERTSATSKRPTAS